MTISPSNPRPQSNPFGSSIKSRSYSAGSEFRFGFNTQEKDKEIYNNNETYTATFWEFDGRLGRRWNVDPKPVPEESYYAVNRNQLTYFSDPKGDNPIIGAIIGLFTEYASKVGSKMIFEDMSFTEANGDLDWADGMDMLIAAGFGAANGAIEKEYAQFATWIKSPTNQKIVVKLLEVGVSSIESSLKQIYKDEEFDLKSILAGAVTEVGLGSLLKNNEFKEASIQAKNNSNISSKKAEDLASRKKPNKKLINNTKKEAATQKKSAKNIDKINNTGKAMSGTVSKIASTKVQDSNKRKKKS